MFGALFYRVAVVMMSLLATAEQTGYFGLSAGIVDVFVPVATLIADQPSRSSLALRIPIASVLASRFDSSSTCQ